MIEVRQLAKLRGKATVLDDVSLTIRDHEVTALVGPSGGGKSTLLRCINGLEPFDRGTVIAEEIHLKHGTNPAATLLMLRGRVGMVFQQFNLFPHMTALENVMSGPRFVLGMDPKAAAEKATALLERVGLADKLASKPPQLSGGQQQRVAIARALAVNPAAVLFDEPTSALDPSMANEVLAVMKDLAADGLTMIVVTHDQDFAERATVVHRMVAGRVVASGSPSDILRG